MGVRAANTPEGRRPTPASTDIFKLAVEVICNYYLGIWGIYPKRSIWIGRRSLFHLPQRITRNYPL